MIIGSRSNNFHFKFGKTFFPKEVKDRYSPYVFRHYIPYDTVEDYMEASIQSMTFPTLNMDPVMQVRAKGKGKKQEYKNSVPVDDLIERTLSVTLRTYEANINYFIFRETLLHHFDFSNDDLYFDDFNVHMMDQEGRVINTASFTGMYARSISEITLSTSDNNLDLKTFTVTFGFFAMSIKLHID